MGETKALPDKRTFDLVSCPVQVVAQLIELVRRASFRNREGSTIILLEMLEILRRNIEKQNDFMPLRKKKICSVPQQDSAATPRCGVKLVTGEENA
jgi:hypothetical protein